MDGVQTAELRRAFERIDRDGSGRISLEELVRAVEPIFPESTPQEYVVSAMQALLTQIDTDGDGKVSYEEFAASIVADYSRSVSNTEPGSATEVNTVAPVVSVASSSLLGTDSPWVGRPPPVAVLPRPAVAVQPREKSCYRNPRPKVPVPPEMVTVLPCTACRKVGNTSQSECRECARALRRAKAEATEKQARAAVRPVRLATRRAAGSTDDAASEPEQTREELCRSRVLTARREAAERDVRLSEAVVAGRPQDWVRHRPQHDRLVPLRIGDVLLPDDGRPWDREEAATVTAVTDLKVHVQWRDSSGGTILLRRIRLPVVRA
eukprot:COSAG02_NODE_5231_length_4520_cov_70.095454_5_plen_321_part_01